MTTLVAQNFDSFVFAQNDDIKTTSLLVAEKFGKLHKDVLKKIESLECSAEFIGRNFALIETDVKVGFGTRKSPAYEMTKDGFMFLVMGFTGKAAAEVKELYINAFNFMLAKLKPVPNALRDLPPQTLTPAMKKHVNQRVNYLVKHQVGASYASLGKLIQDTFNVNKRELILASKYREVCALLDCEPDPKALQGEIVVPKKIGFEVPAGMALIPENELADLKKLPVSTFQNQATMILTSDKDAIYTVQYHKGVSVIMEQPKNVMIGTPENIIRDLKALGFAIIKNDPQNKLEAIEQIVSAKFEA
jgi:Rha family phage regulatory protein